jgi:hypothetical protein
VLGFTPTLGQSGVATALPKEGITLLELFDDISTGFETLL